MNTTNQAPAIRTELRVGDHAIEFKGDVLESEAVQRARAIWLANTRLDHTVRGHLISCLDNFNYELSHV